jgi:hypothetical protein
MAVVVGGPVVVVEPDTQFVVPPVSRLSVGFGVDAPPVLPPVHPLMTMSPDTVPVTVVQEIFPVPAPAVPDSASVRPPTGMSMAANVSKIRLMTSLP